MLLLAAQTLPDLTIGSGRGVVHPRPGGRGGQNAKAVAAQCISDGRTLRVALCHSRSRAPVATDPRGTLLALTCRPDPSKALAGCPNGLGTKDALLPETGTCGSLSSLGTPKVTPVVNVLGITCGLPARRSGGASAARARTSPRLRAVSQPVGSWANAT